MSVGKESISHPVQLSEVVTLPFSTHDKTAKRCEIKRTRAVHMHNLSQSRNPALIPRRFHHMFRDDCLPAKYAMSLRAVVQLHAFRDAGSSKCSNTSTFQNASVSAPPLALIGSTTEESQSDELFDYYFWSDSALYDLKRDRLESADPLYRALALPKSIVELTDMARYLVMYELGGVYADFDVMFIRPVDDLLQRGYPCILSAENSMQVTGYFVLLR